MSTPNSNSHPTALWFIFWGEFAERCCFYGARTIMMLYMTKQLMLPDDDAKTYFFTYKMGCYFLPLIGGYLADRFLGRYWTIVGFSIPYVIGQLLLCLPTGGSANIDFTFLVLSLALLAGGSGVIKPNISSLLGMTYDQKRPGNVNLRFQAFQWFYFSINIGSLLSMITLPMIRDIIAKHYGMGVGYQVAFAIPAVLMILALLAFAAGKRHYAIDKPGPAPALPPEQKRDQWRVVLSLLGVFALYILFWIPYEHNDSLWVLFAEKHVDRSVPWFTSLGLPGELPADWFQWVNAAMVLVLIIFFQWFWPKIDPHNRISPIAKISAGFFFTACAPGILTLCAWMAQDGSKVSYWWMVLAYVVLTFGEVLAYGTGLDFSFGQAPASMKSMITSCFLVTNALANVVNLGWTRTYDKQMTPFQFYGIATFLPLFAAVAILFVGKKFRTKREV
jgi:POT family proton-dependent oligopeptide transporter